MRFQKLILGLVGVGTLGAGVLVGCGSSSGGSDTGGSTTTSSSTGVSEPCEPKAACPSPTAARDCLGLVDNTGKTKFGLRMSELTVTTPVELATGAVLNIIDGAVELNEMPCYLTGSGTFSWLIQFDTTAGTIMTGGAKPVTDPTKGYSFDTEMSGGFSLAPVTITAKPDPSTGVFAAATGKSLIVPIFLDATGTSVVLLPLQAARLKMGTLSADQNCIGSFNAAKLEPANNCLPIPGGASQFIPGGELDGFITLDDADNVSISALQESLCVLLSGNAMMYGMTAMGSSEAVCTRDANNKVIFQGNWCSTKNAPAADGCADAVQLGASFAASSVLIN
jgi:hypothetical protein